MLTKLSASLAAIFAGLALANTAYANDSATTTPIKHVIVVVGENVTFDTLFATYQSASGKPVMNLLSQGIIRADGTPGPAYKRAQQSQAVSEDKYSLDAHRTGPFKALTQPTLIGAYNPATLQLFGTMPDPRFAGLQANGPFQITKFVPYGSPTSAIGDPAHRFFQMWQQTGGDNSRLDLFAWVADTVGTGNATDGVTLGHSGQGGELMGFFNMHQGDAPLFNALAQNFAMSDNYHQAVMGGTGANFFALATAGEAAVYNENGVVATPPANQIENPNPQPGTNNFYTNDGYSGGSYVNCADRKQPGVEAILEFLKENHRQSGCENGAYYLVNNYDTPYEVDGTPKALGADKFVYPPQHVPTIGEMLSTHDVSWSWYTGGREDADVAGDPLFPLFYGPTLQYLQSVVPAGTPAAYVEAMARAAAIKSARPLVYNAIGDPHNASANVVETAALRERLKGLTSLYADIQGSTLPAVSFVVPKNLESGHPGYSVPGKYELFINDLITRVQGNPALWADTAIIVTTDEGGGYFDSGYIQNINFLGDGPRIPLLVVSPYAKKGHVDHVYNDHASISKFIEKNWDLPTLSKRSRDNLPNPKQSAQNPYRPLNQPAIGDLTSLFDFQAK
jgi:phospholipase C